MEKSVTLFTCLKMNFSHYLVVQDVSYIFDCVKFHGVQTPGALMGIKWDYLPIYHLILITLHLFADHFDIKQQNPRHFLIIFIITLSFL